MRIRQPEFDSKQKPSTPWIRVAALCFFLVFLAGCARGCTSRKPPIHLNPNMDNQEKYLPQSENRFFYNGATMRNPVEGTVARGDFHENEAEITGKNPDGTFLMSSPLDANPEVLARGKKHYDIYCTPCHAATGDGESMLKQRAGVRTANLLEDRIRQMPDGQIFDTITNGFGLMQGYRYPIQPHDRWAIIAYVRQLQRGEAGQ